MIEWEPVSEAALLARIAQCQARMSQAELRLWEAIRIQPEKWQQIPYGDRGHDMVRLVRKTPGAKR